MRRLLLVCLIMLLMMSLFAVSGAAAVKPVTIRWYQDQIENAEPLKRMAETYHKENPNVKVEIEVVGNGYYDILKTKIASGDMPDVFLTKGYNELNSYKEYILEISNEPFMKKVIEAARPGITLNGKLMGLPFQMSGNGFVYNKKIFADNNLTVPTTITELKTVCEKMKSKGITPFANQFKDDWLLGQFLGYAFSATPQPALFVNKLNQNKARIKDNPMFLKNLELLDLMLKYGQPSPLDYDWNGANTYFAQGKAAMIYEGIWIYDTVKGVDPKIEVGLFAAPQTDNSSETKLTTDVNGVWHIYKKSKNVAAVKKLFNWIVTSKSGNEWITKDCKFIPAYVGLKSPLNSLGEDVATYLEKKQTYNWAWPSWPDGYYFGSGKVLQEYVLGTKDKAKTLESLDALWHKLAGSK